MKDSQTLEMNFIHNVNGFINRGKVEADGEGDIKDCILYLLKCLDRTVEIKLRKAIEEFIEYKNEEYAEQEEDVAEEDTMTPEQQEHLEKFLKLTFPDISIEELQEMIDKDLVEIALLDG